MQIGTDSGVAVQGGVGRVPADGGGGTADRDVGTADRGTGTAEEDSATADGSVATADRGDATAGATPDAGRRIASTDESARGQR